MAKFKVKQKLGLDAFKVLSSQIKAGTVKIVTQASFNKLDKEPDQAYDVVKDAFNLGNKIEVIVAPDACVNLGGNFAFEKHRDTYYLIMK